MPADRKRKRGHRADKPSKREKLEPDPGFDTQHYSVGIDQSEDKNFVVPEDIGADYISFGQESENHSLGWQDDSPFYGLLDEEEQEYYASVNIRLLGLEGFPSDEDTALFIEAVHRESDGKELKIASSQSCSRYLERLIQVSTPTQVRTLFGRFVGHFLHLVQHRFASHCCEALFLRAAREVGKDGGESDRGRGEGGLETEAPTIEQLFLTVVDELEPNLGYLLTERFASHVLRVLLLVLSGQPLNDAAAGSVLASRKKEKVEAFEFSEAEDLAGSRRVPRLFKHALQVVISGSILGLDTTYIRALATHATGNPMLQILLRVEMLQGGKTKAKDSDSVFKRLLPDPTLSEDTDSAKFVHSILYDPTGSRLLEVIVQHAPGKMFKKLYGNVLKQRMGSMAKNEVASYVAVRILERLSAVDLQAARDEILPEVPTLVARNRLGIIRVLLERCDHRQVDVQPIIAALQESFGADPSTFLLKMLQWTSEDNPDNTQSQREPQSDSNQANIHGTLLASTLAKLPTTRPFMHQVLQSLPSTTLLLLAKNSATSRFLQQSLLPNTSNSSSNSNNAKPKYKPKTTPTQYLPRMLLPYIAELATHPSGSHLVDAFWPSSSDVTFFLKDRIATELAKNQPSIEDSSYGRKVWRNWNMDLYLRRNGDWRDLARGGGGELGSGRTPHSHAHADAAGYAQNSNPRPAGDGGGRGRARQVKGGAAAEEIDADGGNTKPKTALELARLRFVNGQQRHHGNDGPARTGMMSKGVKA